MKSLNYKRRVESKRLANAVLCLLLLTCPLLGQTPQKLPREALVEDFRIMRNSLEEGHSGIYRYTKKGVLDLIFDAAERTLNRPMDVYEFYRVIAPTVAAIKCGHTSAGLPKPLQEELNARTPLLPLQVRVRAGRSYVFRDFSTADGSLAGLELRSVGEVSAEHLIKVMTAAVSADGDIMTAREFRISDWRFAGNLVRLFGLKSPYRVTLWDAARKKLVTANLDGIELPRLVEASKARYPQDQAIARSADLDFLFGGNIARMTIRRFSGFVDAERKKDLEQFFKESFEAMGTRGTRSLIIDVRDNGGGRDELGRVLLAYLIDKPFRYYEDLIFNKLSFDFMKYSEEKEDIPADLVERRADGLYHMVSHPNWGIQQPSAPVFGGKVIMVINGGSFSTTAEFLSQMHFHRRASFVGEESGGGYYGNSSGPESTLILPHSKLTVRIPLLTYYMAVSGYKAASHGVMPNYPISPTIADLLSSKDRLMEKAVELAHSGMP